MVKGNFLAVSRFGKMGYLSLQVGYYFLSR